MPGIFSKAARPARPGGYFDWAATPQATVLPNIASIVALAVTHDWGPANQVIATTSFADFQNKFGPSTNTDAYRSVFQAYLGEGYNNRGGAGQVLVYRIVGSGGAAATATIQNTTPANALTITARYQGTYGQNITLSKQVNPQNNSLEDFLVSVNGTVAETWTHVPTDIAGLAAAINAGSVWVTATSLITGVALGSIPNTALASGNNGTAALAGGDFTNMESALGTFRFSLFAIGDIATTANISGGAWSDSTGNAVLTALLAWQASCNTSGKRFMTVLGGSLADTPTSAVARSALANDPNVVNVGVGGLIDSNLLPTSTTLSTSQLAPRIAGILAARGEEMSLTFSRLSGTTAYGFATDSQVLQAFNGGVIVLSQDTNPDSPVRIEKGLTTYIGGNANLPYLIYRNPKFVRTMQTFELELTDWAATNAVGLLQVNDNTRAYVVGYAKSALKSRADRGVIQDGYTVGVDPNPPPSDNDEFVALVYGIAFGRSVEQVFNLVYVS